MCDCMSLSIQILVFFKISLLVTPANIIINKTKRNPFASLRKSQSGKDFKIDRRTKMDFLTQEEKFVFIYNPKKAKKKKKPAGYILSWPDDNDGDPNLL